MSSASNTTNTTETCEGDGHCLQRVDNTYRHRTGWACSHNCAVKACPNEVVCGRRAPAWYFTRYHGLCQTCLELFGRRLTLRHVSADTENADTENADTENADTENADTENADTEDTCPVCYESVSVLVEFPTDCGHYFCGICSGKLLFYDETRYHLSPVPFGCPPCPNACANPTRGRQCMCAEYDEVLEDWEIDRPSEWLRWTSAQIDSIEDGDETDSFGSRKCPLCRECVNF